MKERRWKSHNDKTRRRKLKCRGEENEGVRIDPGHASPVQSGGGGATLQMLPKYVYGVTQLRQVLVRGGH